MVLDHIHQVVLCEVGTKIHHCLACQLVKQFRLVVIADFRVVHKLIDNDILRGIDDDPALSDDNINAVFLFPEFLNQDLFRYGLIIEMPSIQIKIMKT